MSGLTMKLSLCFCSLLVAVLACFCATSEGQDKSERLKALEKIRELGGHYIDFSYASTPSSLAVFCPKSFTDADLKILQPLSDLVSLNLMQTKISDDCFPHLK